MNLKNTPALCWIVSTLVAAAIPSASQAQVLEPRSAAGMTQRIEFHAGALVPVGDLGEDVGYAARLRASPLVGATIGVGPLGRALAAELQLDATVSATQLQPTSNCTFIRCTPMSVETGLLDLGARIVRRYPFGANSVFFGIGAGERIVVNSAGDCLELVGVFCRSRYRFLPVLAGWPSLNAAAGGVWRRRVPITSQLRVNMTRVPGGRISADLIPTVGVRF